MKKYNAFDFENMLQDEFFSSNDVDDINRDIESRLNNDTDFARKYETWITESSYNSWRDYYKTMEAEEEESWEYMLPEEEEADGMDDYVEEE